MVFGLNCPSVVLRLQLKSLGAMGLSYGTFLFMRSFQDFMLFLVTSNEPGSISLPRRQIQLPC